MTAAEYTSLGTNAGTAIASIAVSGAPTSTKIETGIGTSLLTAAEVPSPASPFLAIAGGISELLGVLGVGSGCGQTCVTATQYANKVSELGQQNLNLYMAIPTPRPKSLQLEALANFDSIWNALVSQCGNPALGTAGQRCISERQRGGKYDYFSYYRDPIANDTNVYDDTAAAASTSIEPPVSATSSTPTLTSGISSAGSPTPIGSPIATDNTMTYLLLGGAALLVLMFMRGGDEE